MGMIDDAVKEGVETGICEALEGRIAEMCDGHDEPQERCPTSEHSMQCYVEIVVMSQRERS